MTLWALKKQTKNPILRLYLHRSMFLIIKAYTFSGDFKPGCGSDSKESACNAEDQGLIPGLGGSPGEGNGYPLQYSCLENLKNREA